MDVRPHVEGARRSRRARELFGGARGRIATARTDDVFLYAAAPAFFGLISAAPLVVVALWITTLLVGEPQGQEVGDDLARLAPPAWASTEHASGWRSWAPRLVWSRWRPRCGRRPRTAPRWSGS